MIERVCICVCMCVTLYSRVCRSFIAVPRELDLSSHEPQNVSLPRRKAGAALITPRRSSRSESWPLRACHFAFATVFVIQEDWRRERASRSLSTVRIDCVARTSGPRAVYPMRKVSPRKCSIVSFDHRVATPWRMNLNSPRRVDQ